MKSLKTKRGFTLIELLVVIAIIGILSSIVLASLNSARQKGRDARRLADIKQIQLALELAYDANAGYPTALTTATLVTPGYISVIPTDPTTNAVYSYTPYAVDTAVGTKCSSYHLGASLEQSGANSPAKSAAKVSAPPDPNDQLCDGGVLTAFTGDVDVKCGADTNGASCFDVLP